MLVGAFAALYKYGDRTDVTDKSLKGTKEALETLLAYLGRSVADAVSPTIEKILGNATKLADGSIKEIKSETILGELSGEAFRDDISRFVNSDIEQLLYYRNLLRARQRWAAWARRISGSIFVLVILQSSFTVYFFVAKALNRAVGQRMFLSTLAVSVCVVAFCFSCWGTMLHYHNKISEYRDKVL